MANYRDDIEDRPGASEQAKRFLTEQKPTLVQRCAGAKCMANVRMINIKPEWTAQADKLLDSGFVADVAFADSKGNTMLLCNIEQTRGDGGKRMYLMQEYQDQYVEVSAQDVLRVQVMIPVIRLGEELCKRCQKKSDAAARKRARKQKQNCVEEVWGTGELKDHGEYVDPASNSKQLKHQQSEEARDRAWKQGRSDHPMYHDPHFTEDDGTEGEIPAPWRPGKTGRIQTRAHSVETEFSWGMCVHWDEKVECE